MSTALQAFAFDDHLVRTVREGEETLWIVRDVCEVLGLGNVTEATKNLDDDELTSVILNSGGQNREMNAVTESGLYNLIFKSRKPEAKTFRRWVTHEVLPQIRKTGSYSRAGAIQKVLEDHSAQLPQRMVERLTVALLEEQGVKIPCDVDTSTVVGFVGDVLASWDGCGCVDDEAIIRWYHEWCYDHGQVVPLPDEDLLDQLAQHPNFSRHGYWTMAKPATAPWLRR